MGRQPVVLFQEKRPPSEFFSVNNPKLNYIFQRGQGGVGSKQNYPSLGGGGGGGGGWELLTTATVKQNGTPYASKMEHHMGHL